MFRLGGRGVVKLVGKGCVQVGREGCVQVKKERVWLVWKGGVWSSWEGGVGSGKRIRECVLVVKGRRCVPITGRGCGCFMKESCTWLVESALNSLSV